MMGYYCDIDKPIDLDKTKCDMCKLDNLNIQNSLNNIEITNVYIHLYNNAYKSIRNSLLILKYLSNRIINLYFNIEYYMGKPYGLDYLPVNIKCLCLNINCIKLAYNIPIYLIHIYTNYFSYFVNICKRVSYKIHNYIYNFKAIINNII